MSKLKDILMFVPVGVKRYLEFPVGGAVLGSIILFLFLGGLAYPPPAIIAFIAALVAMAWVGNRMPPPEEPEEANK